MEAAFAALLGDRGPSLSFWRHVVMDTVCAACWQHVERWTVGMPREGLSWLLWCTGGVMASGVGLLGFLSAIGWLFPPHYGPGGRVHSVINSLPTAVDGVVIGLISGSAQAIALRLGYKRGLTWVALTGLGMAIGMPLAFLIDRDLLGVLDLSHHLSYVIGVAATGMTIGACQSVALTRSVRGAIRWTLRTTFALTAAMAAGIAVSVLSSRAMSPRDIVGFALVFAVLPALIGLVFGLLTLGPAMSSLQYRAVDAGLRADRS
jgi:hypothetical protein